MYKCLILIMKRESTFRYVSDILEPEIQNKVDHSRNPDSRYGKEYLKEQLLQPKDQAATISLQHQICIAL